MMAMMTTVGDDIRQVKDEDGDNDDDDDGDVELMMVMITTNERR